MLDLEARLVDVTRERDYWQSQANIAAADRDRYRAALEKVAYGGHQRGCGAMASCGCREEYARAALEST